MKPIIIIVIVGMIAVIAAGLSMSIIPEERTVSNIDKPYNDPITEKESSETSSSSTTLQGCSGTARCITGSVTKIIDGDTIHVNGESVRFALASAPELSGYGGVESRDFIDTICPVGSDIIVDEDDGQTGESYGRIIGVIYCNGVNLNSELLDADLGYLEERFCDSSEFANDSWAQKHGC